MKSDRTTSFLERLESQQLAVWWDMLVKALIRKFTNHVYIPEASLRAGRFERTTNGHSLHFPFTNS